MDKKETSSVVVRQREGFALLVTLSVLTVIMALTTVLISYLDEVEDDASQTKALIQANALYADITTIFNNFKADKKTLFSTLYLAPFPIATEDGKFMTIISCKPLASGININWLGESNNRDMDKPYQLAQEIFDLLIQEYDLVDGMRLQEMIVEEIMGIQDSSQERYSRFRQKKGIISYQQFTSIVNRYQFEIDDPKVGRIQWDKYFSFASTSKVVDVEYSAPELIALMFGIDVESVREWHEELTRSDLKTFITMNGIDYEAKKSLLADGKFIEESECTVSYKVNRVPYQFRFEYVRGESKYFEFYGKQ